MITVNKNFYINNKWQQKYLKLAKTLQEDNTACYSRSVAVVLVSEDNRIISLGYNGSVCRNVAN